MDERNYYILLCLKRLIEDAIDNEIDQDEFVPGSIINLMAELHSKLKANIK